MKKQTKKHILEFLHFWPMTIVVPILLLLILFPGVAGAKSISDKKHDQFCSRIFMYRFKFGKYIVSAFKRT